jgi:excisionase family DNA binding protein
MKKIESKQDSTPPHPAVIVTKSELARELRVSTRTVENMMAQRIIPFIRATKRSVRFNFPRVLAALEKREVREVGR